MSFSVCRRDRSSVWLRLTSPLCGLGTHFLDYDNEWRGFADCERTNEVHRNGHRDEIQGCSVCSCTIRTTPFYTDVSFGGGSGILLRVPSTRIGPWRLESRCAADAIFTCLGDCGRTSGTMWRTNSWIEEFGCGTNINRDADWKQADAGRCQTESRLGG